jgi:hypothetical protein
MTSYLVHLGTCPVCEGGLRRVRTCGLHTSEIHGLIICEECEAMWTDPGEGATHKYGVSESPACPICHQAIWSDNSRWSTVEDVCLLGWYSVSYIERIEQEDL